jgi:hypothetical protein
MYGFACYVFHALLNLLTRQVFGSQVRQAEIAWLFQNKKKER